MLNRLKQLVGHVLCNLGLHYVSVKYYIHEFKVGEGRYIVVIWHGLCSRCGAEVQKKEYLTHEPRTWEPK